MSNSDIKTTLVANKDNTGMLRRLVEECASYDGTFEDTRVYEFDDEFFDMFFEGKPLEAVQRAHFGNIQSWTDEYIRFDGYGNLESLNEYQYDEELKSMSDEIIDETMRLVDDGSIDIDYILYDLRSE